MIQSDASAWWGEIRLCVCILVACQAVLLLLLKTESRRSGFATYSVDIHLHLSRCDVVPPHMWEAYYRRIDV
jgi:hypothetical protein